MDVQKDLVYRTLTGRTVDLKQLTKEERICLKTVVENYREQPDWTRFAAWWMKHLAKCGLTPKSPVYRICDDLEARLGIAQGKAAPPDYREYLLALIEERYGSRYKFCKETGIDQGQLSKILAGRADFSLDTLTKALRVLHAALVVQTDEALRKAANPDDARRVLESVAH